MASTDCRTMAATAALGRVRGQDRGPGPGPALLPRLVLDPLAAAVHGLLHAAVVCGLLRGVVATVLGRDHGSGQSGSSRSMSVSAIGTSRTRDGANVVVVGNPSAAGKARRAPTIRRSTSPSQNCCRNRFRCRQRRRMTGRRNQGQHRLALPLTATPMARSRYRARLLPMRRVRPGPVYRAQRLSGISRSSSSISLRVQRTP